LSAGDASACTTDLMDIAENANAAGTDCSVNPTLASCCPRLTATCDDGPTVFESQMCDLIRAMGGLPGDNDEDRGSGRAHSAPEHGSRSARRLIESMLPAWAQGYDEGDPADVRNHLRLTCVTGSTVNGQPCPDTCDPRVDSFCPVVPIVTIFLTDEEDFYFKDDCKVLNGAPSQSQTDIGQLPSSCRFADGDILTEEACTRAYCESKPYNYGVPAALNHDLSAQTNQRGFTLRWRPDCDNQIAEPACEAIDGCAWINNRCADGDNGARTASTTHDLACSPYPEYNLEGQTPQSCIGDPCPLLTTQGACEQAGYSDFFTGMTAFAGKEALCQWSAITGCRSPCYNIAAGASEITHRANCLADPRCDWDQSMVVRTIPQTAAACVPKYQPNDCQACKRLMRTVESLEGSSGDLNICNDYSTVGTCNATFMCAWNGGSCQPKSLIGFRDFDDELGQSRAPVYAIVRNRGEPGRKDSALGDDQCDGAPITWGRGDGQGYRDLAIGTSGRTQNVCASRYDDFMQVVLGDMVALSSPYPLCEKPVAATIKVGIARPHNPECAGLGEGACNGDTDCEWIDDFTGVCGEVTTPPKGCFSRGFDYVPVPRSRTQGFLYDPNANSIGFKTEAVDGICSGSCSPNGVIDASEIQYARTAEHVPQTGDIVYISYRFWEAVPCRSQCTSEEICGRIECPAEVGAACVTEATCTGGRKCLNGECTYDCDPQETVNACEPTDCGPCEERDGLSGLCELTTTDRCICNPGPNPSCDPSAPNTCGANLICSETCECLPNVDACNAADCDDQETCCAQWAADELACSGIFASGPCDADSRCDWIEASGLCRSENAPCCGFNETAVCYDNAETGERAIFCDASDCSCTEQACSDTCYTEINATDCDNAPGSCAWNIAANRCESPTCDADKICFNGQCGCKPVEMYCNIDAGCVCQYNPR
jgi:hypothetical protein